MKLSITHNGQPFNKESLLESIKSTAANNLREQLKKKIRPFQAELDRYNAKVTINISPELNGSVSVTDIPEELKERIAAAFKK